MKSVFHKISAIIMGFVVLFSTMSFTIDMHYCGDTLVDTAIFHKAKSCGMEMSDSNTNLDCSIIKKNCCSEKQINVKGQDELKLTFEKFTFAHQVFMATLVYTYSQLFEDLEDRDLSFSEYPPPLIVKSIYKLDEVYLI